ncbi:hypothetical protein [Paludibacterium yongneupense]|uniref:hypothetical protein n=1 Tax=Paludibacterium yongneupense TaxID=400061 RepID=UPI00048CDBC3|nr:hypothetical protein [Paludibacterium yongneupense]
MFEFIFHRTAAVILFAVIITSLAGCAATGNLTAEQLMSVDTSAPAQKPKLTVGDKWSYHSTSFKDYSIEVAEVTNKSVDMKYQTGGHRIFLPSLNYHYTNEELHSDVYVKMYSWPLTTGKKWEYPTYQDGHKLTTTAIVVGYESITVPAGKFMAVKIVYRCKWFRNGASGDAVKTIWYSPVVKSYVREQIDGFDAGGVKRYSSFTELLSYNVI